MNISWSGKYAELFMRFILDDVGGIVLLDKNGDRLYIDDKAEGVLREATHWKSACPPPRVGQKGEVWDLLITESRKSYMVTTSTFVVDGEMMQMHLIMDNSTYTSLFHEITLYTQGIRDERDRDGMTGLYNRRKLTALKQTTFQGLEAIAVYSMDLNNLKRTNDTCGHEAGDRLIIKAADSLRRVSSDNVFAFRVGGDEFVLVAMNVSREQALALLQKWEEGLAELNRAEDGVMCVIARGMAYGAGEYDFDALFGEADQKMYEDKRARKQSRENG